LRIVPILPGVGLIRNGTRTELTSAVINVLSAVIVVVSAVNESGCKQKY
jgi:hypothetical protein